MGFREGLTMCMENLDELLPTLKNSLDYVFVKL